MNKNRTGYSASEHSSLLIDGGTPILNTAVEFCYSAINNSETRHLPFGVWHAFKAVGNCLSRRDGNWVVLILYSALRKAMFDRGDKRFIVYDRHIASGRTEEYTMYILLVIGSLCFEIV